MIMHLCHYCVISSPIFIQLLVILLHDFIAKTLSMESIFGENAGVIYLLVVL